MQAVHVVPTPRVGGVAVVSVLAGAFVFLAPEPVREITTLLVVSLVPVFFAGLAEDMGFGVSPRGRLVAAALSSAVAISLLKVWLSRTGIPVIDDLIALAPAGVLFTIFATTGVCHAFNLVDGVNGLSGTVTSVVALGLAGLALQADDPALAIAALMVVPATLGFLVFNFPFGKIFMGDAGAYSLGHVLSWIAVIMLFRADGVTPWAIVLVFFWPLAETFFTIYRRVRAGKPVTQPDRMHFHQVVTRGLEISFIGRSRRHISNPLTTVILAPCIAAPTIVGVWLWNDPPMAIFSVVSYFAVFVASYLVLVHYVKVQGRKLG